MKRFKTWAWALLAALLFAQQAPAQPVAPDVNANESRAIAVVREWTEAYNRKDVDKASSYFEDNVQFRIEPGAKVFFFGRDALRKTLGELMTEARTSTGGPLATFQISNMKIVRTSAIGADRDVLVIVQRSDTVKVQGKPVPPVTASGFFRVNPKTWKIEEWLDAPI